MINDCFLRFQFPDNRIRILFVCRFSRDYIYTQYLFLMIKYNFLYPLIYKALIIGLL
jgi:hypothetical protein